MAWFGVGIEGGVLKLKKMNTLSNLSVFGPHSLTEQIILFYFSSICKF